MGCGVWVIIPTSIIIDIRGVSKMEQLRFELISTCSMVLIMRQVMLYESYSRAKKMDQKLSESD